MIEIRKLTLGTALVLGFVAGNSRHLIAAEAIPAVSERSVPAAKVVELDPCSLLTANEVAVLMGTTATAERNGSKCRWKPATGPGSVTLNIVAKNGQQAMAQQKKFLGVDEELAGIGNSGFRSGLIYGIQVGDRYVHIVVAPNFPKPAPKPAVTTDLVEKAIGRLPV